MSDILLIISTGLFGVGLFVFEPYINFVAAYLNYKPFNCVLCMTFWGATIIFYLIDFPVYYSIISGVVAELTYRKIVNYEGE